MTRFAHSSVSAGALLIVLSACTNAVDPVADPTPAASATAATTPTVTPSPRTSYAPVRVQFVLEDRDTKRRRADIPFTYTPEGGKPVRLVSGPEGTATLDINPGFYRARVLIGCHRRTMVTFGASARFGVAPDTPMQIPLAVSAQRRFHAGPPVLWDAEPPWGHGETVSFRFLLYDRCRDDKAPKTRFDDLEFAPSSNLEVIGIPTKRSDGDSLARLLLRCTGSGDARLILQDPQNSADRIDLLKVRPPQDPGATWCA